MGISRKLARERHAACVACALNTDCAAMHTMLDPESACPLKKHRSERDWLDAERERTHPSAVPEIHGCCDRIE